MGEKHGVIFYLVDFKDDEPLIEEVGVPIGIERHFQLSAPVKLFQDGGEVADGETDFLQRRDLGDALQGELVIGIKGEFTHFELPLLNFQMVYLPVYLGQHGVLVQFQLKLLHNPQGAFPFGWGGSRIMGKRVQGAALAQEFMAAGFRGQHQRTTFRFFGLFRRFLFVNQPVDVLHFVVILLMVALHPGGYQQFLP